jgi:hypothetical protein
MASRQPQNLFRCAPVRAGGIQVERVTAMGSCVKEGRTAGPSAALGMTKGSEVTFIKSCQMDRKKLQLRSWLA